MNAPAVTVGSTRRKSQSSWLQPERVKALSLLFVLLVTLVAFSFAVPDYLSSRFVSRLAIAISITAVLAAGEALVIITRNIDLSVGATLGVAAYLTAELLADNPDLPAAVAVLFAVGVGALLGVVNGVLVAYGRVPSIIVTLGTLSIFRSVLTSHAGGRTIATGELPAWMVDLPRSTVFTVGQYEIRTMFVVAVVVVVLLHLGSQYLRVGRHLYALGSNPDAARQVGLASCRLQVTVFVGVWCAGRTRRLPLRRPVRHHQHHGRLGPRARPAIAAAVVGGVSTLGGSGTILGSFLGAILIGVLDQSSVRVEQISEFWRDAILGILILLAVLLDVAVGRRSA